jgi:DNA-binding NarL/FixJ family response regulator
MTSDRIGRLATDGVLIADDDEAYREGLRVIFEREGWKVLHDARDCDEALYRVERTSPAVVVTDLLMPPTKTDEGFQIAERLETTNPGLGVLILSARSIPQIARRLSTKGQCKPRRGYILKDRSSAEKVEAVTKIAQGHGHFDQEIHDDLLALLAEMAEVNVQLSKEEFDVMELLLKGIQYGEIAEKLFISTKGVEARFKRAANKLKVAPGIKSNRRVNALTKFLAYLERQRDLG